MILGRSCNRNLRMCCGFTHGLHQLFLLMRIPVFYNSYCVKIEYLLFSTISTSFIFKLKISYLCTKTGVTVVCSLRYIATRKDNLMNALLFFHFNFTCIVLVAALAASQQAKLHWLAHCLHTGTGQCRHCRASRVHAGTTSHLIQQIAATTRYVRREKSLPSCAGPVIACSCSCTYLFGQFIPKQLSCRLVRFLYMNYLQFTISSVRLFSPHYRNAFVTYL